MVTQILNETSSITITRVTYINITENFEKTMAKENFSTLKLLLYWHKTITAILLLNC